MRIAPTIFTVLLILGSTALAEEPSERLKRVQIALAGGDLAAASKELGFVVTEKNAGPVGTAVQDRLTALAADVTVRADEAALPEVDGLRKREAAATWRLRTLRETKPPPAGKVLSDGEFMVLRNNVEDLTRKEQELRRDLKRARSLSSRLERVADELPARLETASGRLEALSAADPDPLNEFLGETVRLVIATLERQDDLCDRAPEVLRREIETLEKEIDAAFQELTVVQGTLTAAATARDGSRSQSAERLEGRETTARDALADLTDPIARFDKETEAESLRIRAAGLRAAIALDEAVRLRTSEELTQTRILDTRDRLVAWFGTHHRATATDAKILKGRLDRLREKRSQLERRLLPRLLERQEETVPRQSAAHSLLWDIETPLVDLPEALVRLREAVPPEREADADAAWLRRVDALRGPLEKYAAALDEAVREGEVVAGLYAERRDVIGAADAFIVKRLIWVRNESAFGPELVPEAGAELRRLYVTYSSPTLRQQVREAVGRGVWRFVLVFGGVLMLGVAGVLLTLRFSRFQAGRKYRGGPILAFLQRFTVIVVISAIGPACLAAASLLLPLLGLPDALGHTAGIAILFTAKVYFVRRLALRVFRDEGIAVTMFKLDPEVAGQICRATRWAVRGILLFVLPKRLLESDPHLLVLLPRLLGMVAFVWLAAVVLHLLRRRRPLMRALVGESGFWHRALGVAWPALVLAAFLLLVMVALGYQYGAELIYRNILQTLVSAAILTALYRGISGAIRRTARASGIVRRDAAEEAIQQASRVFGYAAIAVTAVLLANFWGVTDFLRNLLDSVHLTTVDAENEVFLSLWSVAIALAWIVGGHLLLRNLPGLYDLLLFPRMERTDKGTRFVITTVSKYLVFLVAYSAALLALHFSFSSLGWLFAAASVGIGFGLQEIISNFISGLILFFERPVRVGDVVSVGTTTGTVDKIAIRATHVTNFDRQVIIIPNRRFIIDDVVNWSHNDLTIRRRVQVGVAYGTDVAKVVSILEKIAADHPRVKKHPKPQILFMAFGASSLDIDMLVFIDIQDRWVVESEINRQITLRFAEEGVEIPFPQRDLHVRSVQDAAVLKAIGDRSDAPADGDDA